MVGRNIAWSLIVLCSICTAYGPHACAQRVFHLVEPDLSNVTFDNSFSIDQVALTSINKYNVNGAGVAAGDLNNDGLVDLFFTSNHGTSELYLNKGQLKFKRVDASISGIVVPDSSFCTGVLLFDVNQDGLLDVFISRGGSGSKESLSNLCFVNQGDETFKELGNELGFGKRVNTTHAGVLDGDNDGDLDLLTINYPSASQKTKAKSSKKGEPSSNAYYLNRSGQFVESNDKWGLDGFSESYSLSLVSADFNNDNRTDLLIANDFTERDQLYMNGEDGFKETLMTNTGRTTQNSMGSYAADFNNDLLPDFFTVDMTAQHNYKNKTTMASMNPDRFYKMVDRGDHFQYMYNMLQINLGEGLFRDVGLYSSIDKTDWSWAPLAADFNQNGWVDIYVTNGVITNNHKDLKMTHYYEDGMSVEEMYKAFYEANPSDYAVNYIYSNKGGLEFEDVSDSWVDTMATISHGAAWADLDNDGDLDIVVNNTNSPAFVLENLTDSEQSRYLKVEFDGKKGNLNGIGAKVIIYTVQGNQMRENFPWMGYQSSSQHIVHFGLGSVETIDSLHVIWPTGEMQKLNSVGSNQTITVKQAEADLTFEPAEKPKPLFTTVKGEWFRHKENDFDDFKDEILLPYKTSTLGPRIAVGDLNGDGLDDFHIGGASGQAGAIYVQNSSGKFQAKQLLNDSIREDIDSYIADIDGDNSSELIVCSGGNEFEPGSDTLSDRIYSFKKGTVEFDSFLEKTMNGSNGTVVHVSGLFNPKDHFVLIGNRIIPGRYPLSPESQLLKYKGGTFIDVTADIAPFLNDAGMVTKTLFQDMDADGKPDLILCSEWGAIRVFKNNGDGFDEAESDELSSRKGWWNTVCAVDVNNDGLLDLVGGNNGLNFKFKASPEKPFPMYVKDFDGTGDLDIVLGYHDEGKVYPVRGLQCSSEEMPFIKKKFPTYHEFASLDLPGLYGTSLDSALQFEVTDFASYVFINEGNFSFRPVQLPLMAQMSSINAVYPEDFDGDGHTDLLVGGNLLNTEVETPRNDASIGWLLKGDGTGNFETVSHMESGVNIPGQITDIEKVNTQNGPLYLVSRNNDSMVVLKPNR